MRRKSILAVTVVLVVLFCSAVLHAAGRETLSLDGQWQVGRAHI